MKCPFQERDFAPRFVHPSIDAGRPEVGQQADTEGRMRAVDSSRRQPPRRRTVIEDSSLASLNPAARCSPNLP